MGKVNFSISILWSVLSVYNFFITDPLLLKCCRICIHVWQIFDVCFVGNYIWSLWSKTCYSYRGYHSVSIYVNELYTFFKLCNVVFHNYRCLLDFSVIFNTLFGLSTSFWMAVLMRFLLGSLNGLLGPVKVPFFITPNN